LIYLKTKGEEPVLHASLWNNHDVKIHMDVKWDTAWRKVALTAETSDDFRIKDQIKSWPESNITDISLYTPKMAFHKGTWKGLSFALLQGEGLLTNVNKKQIKI